MGSAKSLSIQVSTVVGATTSTFPMVATNVRVEVELDADGRWLADVPEIPGPLA